MDGYSLSRDFWDFCFDNPEKVKPTHISIYFFAIEHCNRLGWKKKFGLPTSMVLEAIGIKSYSVYKKCFDDLIEWGFFLAIEYSKNQYSSNIIALKENHKANTKALSKALSKHGKKQVQSIVSINKQDTLIPLNNKPFFRKFAHLFISYEDFEKLKIEYSEIDILDCFDRIENYKENTKYSSLYLTSKQWLKKQKEDKLKSLNNGKSNTSQKPSYRGALANSVNNNQQTKSGDIERELSEDS